MVVTGNLVDIEAEEIYGAEINIENGKIISIKKNTHTYQNFILPGFIDAHVHIESSLMVPSEFAKLAVMHGTVATISDPHEIANVCGENGVKFMIENGNQVPFKFFFGAPSCVPATSFETAGDSLNATKVDRLLQNPEIWYLSEMMNFPGVLANDTEVMQKIKSAKKYNKPVDGHAPGLRNDNAQNYFASGISTDHECYTIEEAEEKIKYGVNILIREGSAARNFNDLIPLIKDHWRSIMFCSDDKHPDELLIGHINKLVSKAVGLGYNVYKVLTAACINPVNHYNIPVGYLKNGHNADFIVVNNLADFDVLQTYINGEIVFENGVSAIKSVQITPINKFTIEPIKTDDIVFTTKENYDVIVCIDGQLITNRLTLPAAECTPANDILKMILVNRYQKAPIATAYVKNFGIKKGAIASSVAHDSHNIIAVGVNEKALAAAVNKIINHKGGLCATENNNNTHILPLDIAGLMSSNDAYKVSSAYSHLNYFAKNVLGSTLRAPFMSLSFMALLVIPHIKLSDKGLFDADIFALVD